MVRHFDDRPIGHEVLEVVLMSANRGPSAGFAQGVDMLVLTDSTRRKLFWELASQPHWRDHGADAPGLLKAPAIVVPVIDASAYVSRYAKKDKASSDLAGLSNDAWAVPYWTVDAAFSVMLMLLAATDNGLGALFFRLHADQGIVLSGLGVPRDRTTIGALAFGYEAKPTRSPRSARSSAPGRRTITEVVHDNFW